MSCYLRLLKRSLPYHGHPDALCGGGGALEHAVNNLKKDKEIVLAAVKKRGYALEYAHKSLKKDREIVLEAVKEEGYALEYADRKFRKDREIVLEAVKNDGSAIVFANKIFRKDKEIVLEVVKDWKQDHALKYVDYSLRDDPDILKAHRKKKIFHK